MIKILHTGDIHLGSLTGPEKNGINLRREDTLRCMDEIVQTAREERPDLTIIAGDLFNRSRVWADTALDDVRDAVERYPNTDQKMAEQLESEYREEMR